MENESPIIQAEEERAATAQAEARSDLADYLDVNQQRRRLFPRAALVGLLAGIIGVAFRAMLAAADALLNALLTWLHSLPVWAGCFQWRSA